MNQPAPDSPAVDDAAWDNPALDRSDLDRSAAEGTAPATLGKGFADLTGRGVVCAEGQPVQHTQTEDLFEEEKQVLSGCGVARQQHFTASRLLAHQAFRALGVKPGPLLNHRDRSPKWPGGVVGSLTHTQQLCAVAVAKTDEVRAIGIDAEVDAPLRDGIVQRVLTASERVDLKRLGAERAVSPGSLAALAFSAKESVYKCQFPLTGQFLGFHDAEVTFDWPRRRFNVQIVRPKAAAVRVPRSFDGQFCRYPGMWLTAVVLRRH